MIYSYWCLKSVELLESQKSSFSIFLALKGLNTHTHTHTKITNHLKPPKLVRHHFSSNFNKTRRFFWFFIENLTVSLPVARLYTAQTMRFSIKDFFSKCEELLNKSLMENFHFLCSVTRMFFKECLISFVMICRLIDFAIVVL